MLRKLPEYHSKALTFDVQSHSVFGSLSILEEQSRPGGRSYREEFYAKNRNYGTIEWLCLT